MPTNHSYYLHTILRRLYTMRDDYEHQNRRNPDMIVTLGYEALNDEIAWLEDYIETIDSP